MLEDLENRLKYVFKNKELLVTALTHPSADNVNYERLEFLGDAVLELSVSELLYTMFPDESEGYLTKLRAQIVCGNSLSGFAESIGLGRYLILGNSEEKNNGRNRKSILENVAEAILGAVFLDSDYNTAKTIIYDFISVIKLPDVTDYKSQLQELLQSIHIKDFSYVLISETGPDHEKLFECGLQIEGRIKSKGKGRSKKEAEKNAAKNYLSLIKEKKEQC